MMFFAKPQSNAGHEGSSSEADSIAHQPTPSAQSRAYSWAREIVSIFVLLATIIVIRSSFFSVYIIPTGSMLPTIKIDDRIVANKLAYGLMFPFTERQAITWNKPMRGDIVLFQSPVEDHTFVKRVAGIETDRITFRNGILFVNAQPVVEVEQTDRSELEDMGDDPSDRTLFLESHLGTAAEHTILRANVGGTTFLETREFVVPKGKLFCLGDNRDGSNDSRFWGFVDADRIYGRASFVFYSTIRHEGWIPRFRKNRFFKFIQ